MNKPWLTLLFGGCLCAAYLAGSAPPNAAWAAPPASPNVAPVPDEISPPRFLKAWGQEGTGDGQFNAPIGIAINATDEVFVTDAHNNCVQRFTNDGRFLDKFATGAFPGGIAVDRDGLIYVAVMMGHKISVFRPKHQTPGDAEHAEPYELVREWGQKGAAAGEFDQPGGLAFGRDGSLIVCDQVNHRVQRFTPEGRFLDKWGEYGALPGQFGAPEGPGNRVGGPCLATTDREGNIYTTEPTAGRIQKFSPAGKYLSNWGSNEVRAGAFGGGAKLKGPIAIAIDRDNRAWVSATNHRVQLFTNEGHYLTGLGNTATPGQSPGQFHTPHGMAFDSRGNLYVVDTQNYRVQKFAFESAAHTTAEQRDVGAATINRQVTFKLTFANRDLIWFGDPGSPTALVYPKPGIRPIATDLYVATTVENDQSRCRRYLREARIAESNNTRKVYAFTKQREKFIGAVDDRGRFSPNEFYKNNRELLSTWPADASAIAYDSQENALYYEVDIPGPLVTDSLDFLPLELSDAAGNAVAGHFSIDFATPDDRGAAAKSSLVSLSVRNKGKSVVLAKANVPRVFRRADVELCSFDNKTGTYLPEAAYRAGATRDTGTQPSVTVAFTGEFTSAVRSEAASLIVVDAPQPADQPKASHANITIDGNFDDWRDVAGVDDRRGDLVPYLEYVPDVDILEFKVSHDDQHIYLYARVAGQVGRSHPDGGRSYFYAYIDVDRDRGTGFLPTRDDECYYGVDIGDDCEVQFEFVNNAFRKTFYGFCGLGGDANVLKQQLTTGKSRYGRFEANGIERANYKSEYTYRDGITEITEDLKRGTSDTIRLAVSPDGHEVEVASTFTGFLKDSKGRPIVKLGQTIDVAAGMECDSKAYIGKTNWAADNTIAIRDYRLSPTNRRTTTGQPAND